MRGEHAGISSEYVICAGRWCTELLENFWDLGTNRVLPYLMQKEKQKDRSLKFRHLLEWNSWR